MSPLKNVSDDDVGYLVKGESLVIRQVFYVQVKKEDFVQQKENILYTSCHISNKIYNMIIDGGNYAYVVSATLVNKLNLNTTKHLTPYRL